MIYFLINKKKMHFEVNLLCYRINKTSCFSTLTLFVCLFVCFRYYAIVKPLKYPTRMTKRVVAFMMVNVWLSPAFISFTPIFLGWYTTREHQLFREKHPNICDFKASFIDFFHLKSLVAHKLCFKYINKFRIIFFLIK